MIVVKPISMVMGGRKFTKTPEGEEESQHEGLEDVWLKAVETTAAGDTLDEVFHLVYKYKSKCTVRRQYGVDSARQPPHHYSHDMLK